MEVIIKFIKINRQFYLLLSVTKITLRQTISLNTEHAVLEYCMNENS